jgi:hypothetical protein
METMMLIEDLLSKGGKDRCTSVCVVALSAVTTRTPPGFLPVLYSTTLPNIHVESARVIETKTVLLDIDPFSRASSLPSSLHFSAHTINQERLHPRYSPRRCDGPEAESTHSRIL